MQWRAVITDNGYWKVSVTPPLMSQQNCVCFRRSVIWGPGYQNKLTPAWSHFLIWCTLELSPLVMIFHPLFVQQTVLSKHTNRMIISGVMERVETAGKRLLLTHWIPHTHRHTHTHTQQKANQVNISGQMRLDGMELGLDFREDLISANSSGREKRKARSVWFTGCHGDVQPVFVCIFARKRSLIWSDINPDLEP